ncbi:cbb3-type cytochrome oxidase assembly protein CcoS [Yoonia sp. 2307UL14-13]|uniref:cbb3-type cytochrome oxidase assembly protein CcoS n=1 Tax=Yoonia sp. 2307UL14-13 TaxID=3126506 RepID=UPI0030AB65BE
MNILVILIPASLILGALGLLAFLWSLRANQYDDLEGDAWRILSEDEPPTDD